MTNEPDPARVPASAWAADELARQRGRVEMFHAGRPGGLSGWTMDLTQYELVTNAIRDALETAGSEGMFLQDLVEVVQVRLGSNAAFPSGRLRSYCTFVKLDLEARGLVERLAVRGRQRLRMAG